MDMAAIGLIALTLPFLGLLAASGLAALYRRPSALLARPLR